MIGLIASAVARNALALPIRPPFLRFSSVSSAPKTRVRAARSTASASTSSIERALGGEAGAGQRDRADAHRHRPAVDDPDRDVVGDRPGGEFGALHGCRECARQRDDDDAGGALGEELAICLLELAGRRRGGLGQGVLLGARAQNSAVVSSSRSMNSSSPKRIDSGTTRTPCSATTSSGRSQDESVTIRMLTGTRAYWPGRVDQRSRTGLVADVAGADGRVPGRCELDRSVRGAVRPPATEVGEPPARQHEHGADGERPVRGRSACSPVPSARPVR